MSAAGWDASRREFLRSAALAGGGLVLAVALPVLRRGGVAHAATGDAPGAINAFVKIGSDDSIVLVMHKSEMGQGIYTGLVQLLAEELNCDMSCVRLETAPVAAAYNHPIFGMQITGGSMSIASSWSGLRTAGATARMLLVEAAAQRWQVSAAQCRAERGMVYGPGGHKASFGQLADAAAKLPPPDPKSVVLKSPEEFVLIGKPVKRIEGPEKIDGSGQFGLDVRVPQMLRAVLARPPALGSIPKNIDDTAARGVRGVLHVVPLSVGVAVVAQNTFAARKGRDALHIEWQSAAGPAVDTERLRTEYRRLAGTDAALIARNDGDAAMALRSGTRHLEAVYELPYLSHASMEPLNCVADWRPERCDIWTGTQMQTLDRAAAAQVAGLPPEKIFVHTTLLGGGFGRRANPSSDFVREAVELSRKLKAPVQVVWTREDDMSGQWFRPQWTNRLRASLGADGKPLGWHHTVVGQSIMAGTVMEGMVKDGIDPSSVEGAADLPYAVPHVRVDLHTTTVPVKVQWWRSVGHSNTCFAVESFLDECAAAAGIDPVQYRRSLLGDRHPRHRAVLELLAEKSGWGQPLPAGRARGIALHESFDSVVGEVAEVSLDNGLPRVHRVVAVIDCGTAVNPQLIAAQLESAVNYGLSAALYGEMTFVDGKLQQTNFDTYPVVRIDAAPAVEAYVVPSTQPPTGVGEPGLPPIAPAVANAIFALSGTRVRRLPMIREGRFTA